MLNSVVEYLKNSYEKYPDKSAIVYNNQSESYEELYVHACKVAKWIKRNVNTRRKPILVLMKNSTMALNTFWGIALSGNIYVPIDIDTPQERFEIIISIVEPVCVIICEEVEKFKYKLSYDVVFYEELIKERFENDIIEDRLKIIDTDPLYILFTSGSTGTPKGVVISHRSIIDFTEETSENMNFSNEEKFLNQAPFYFDASVPDIYCTIRNGATLHIVNKQMYVFPIKVVDYIEKNKINTLFWVPSALILVANSKVLKKRDLSSLKKVMFCGEVMPVKQLNMWREVLEETIFVNFYGPSEATYACSYYVIDREFTVDEVLPIGKAAINTEILLVNDSGEMINVVGEIGEIYVRGSGVALGYYNNLEKTKESFVQNPTHALFPEIVYKTGDLAHYNNEGNIIFDGRADYQIKYLGYRIELGEIESQVNSLKGIRQAACVFYEKEDTIICYYSGDVENVEIKKELKNKLPFYMIPHKILKMDELPMNENGKIDRKKLKEGLQ